MKFVVIAGSNRKDSGSRKVANFIAHTLSKDHEVEVLDFHETPLPLWEESFWQGDEAFHAPWKPISEKLESADGFVVISPEWAGMASPVLKNFFLYAGHEMAHKPALLVGVSAARGAAFPVAELRASSYKNRFINYLPEHILVRNVKEVLGSMELSDQDSKEDQYLKERIWHALGLLVSYTKAFREIRKDKTHDLEKYGNGMS